MNGTSQPASVVLVTDVPFWRRETGAHQRIFALARHLSQNPIDLTILYTAAFNCTPANNDLKLLEGTRLTVLSLIDHWMPTDGVEDLIRQSKGRLDKLQVGKQPRTTQNNSASKLSPRLADFHSDETKNRFDNFIKHLLPQAVIVEFLTLAYLVPTRDQRNGIRYFVDTHDLLSSRCQQFQQHGFPHWIDLSTAEETAALQVFDVVIAIQHEEADEFQKMTNAQQIIIVAGHPVELNPPSSSSSSSLSSSLTVAYFASDNSANEQALDWFLKHVWPEVLTQTTDVEFLIAGSICDSFSLQKLPARTRRLPIVKSKADFYAQVDIVANPIQFGTGIKIKNLEALSFGKPLVTTTHGVAGMAIAINPETPWRAAASASEMAIQLTQVCHDEKLRTRLSIAAREYVESQLQPDQVFAQLIQELRS